MTDQIMNENRALNNNTPPERKKPNPGLRLGIPIMLLVTMLFIAMLVTGDEGDSFFVFTAIFWFPILLIGLGIFIFHIVRQCKPDKRNSFSRAIVIWGIANILLLAAVLIHDSRKSDKVDAKHLVAHYVKHEREIWDAAEYARSAMDSGAWMRLEFDGKQVEMFHTRPAGNTVSNNWREYHGSTLDADSIGKRIGLTHDEIEGIRQRLEAAGCISIELTNYGSVDSVTYDYFKEKHPVSDVDYIIIGRCRYMMSMYFYDLYKHPMSDTLWNKLLLDDVTSIPICDTMALEYGSPAFGDISYPQRDKIIKQLNIKKR